VYGAAIGTTIAFSWYVFGHLALTRRLLDANGTQSTRARAVAVRSGGFAAVMLLVYALGIAVVMAWGCAVVLDRMIPGTAGEAAALFGGGVSSFAVYLVLGIRGLRRCGYDLREDLSRDVHPVGSGAPISDRGAA
jgi:hypothetical protein